MSVTVIIKSATQSVEDFGVDCEFSWTIGRLKEILEESYPNNPKKESQKLIYGGKLLPDHLSLKSILNQSQDRHIIHLVCPTPFKTDTNESKKAAPQSFPVPPINPGFSPLNPPNFSTMPGTVPITTINTADTFQQYLAMQQMYTQFFTYYLSQYNGSVPPVVPYAPSVSVPPAQTPQGANAQQNLTPNRPIRRAPEEERDFLDYFYRISRAMLLFAALYYSSSLNRILLVIFMFMFISMFRQLQRRQQEQQRPASDTPRSTSAPRQQAPADIEPAEMQATETDESVSSSSTESSMTTDSLSQQAEQRSFASVVSTTLSLMSAFFTSLISADPVPVNVN